VKECDDLFDLLQRSFPELLLSERKLLAMDMPFLDTYVRFVFLSMLQMPFVCAIDSILYFCVCCDYVLSVRLLISTCQRRGCLVTGGMAPYVPTGNKDIDTQAFQKIIAEKKKYDAIDRILVINIVGVHLLVIVVNWSHMRSLPTLS
jgi:hypothetical protein